MSGIRPTYAYGPGRVGYQSSPVPIVSRAIVSGTNRPRAVPIMVHTPDESRRAIMTGPSCQRAHMPGSCLAVTALFISSHTRQPHATINPILGILLGLWAL